MSFAIVGRIEGLVAHVHVDGFEDVERIFGETGEFHFGAEATALIDDDFVHIVAGFASVGKVASLVVDQRCEVAQHCVLGGIGESQVVHAGEDVGGDFREFFGGIVVEVDGGREARR